MSPNDSVELKKLNRRSTVLMSVILAILVVYFPLINSNTKKATEAYDKSVLVEGVIGVKLDAMLEKLDIYIETHTTETENIKKTIEANRKNTAEVTNILLEKGVLKSDQITVRDGNL